MARRSAESHTPTASKTFIKRHPALTYFALVFAISLGVALIVVGPGGFPVTLEQSDPLFLHITRQPLRKQMA